MTETLYLSRRNLLTLLSKLDREARGELTSCTIIKQKVVTDPFVQTMDICRVVAVEDSEYYTNREAGPVHPSDDPNNKG